MQTGQGLFAEIRDLISRDELLVALEKMRAFLADSPHLTEILQQSGRYQYIRKEIRLGTVSHADAALTENQVRFGILDLLNDIEGEGVAPRLPPDLAENLAVSTDDEWVASLRQDLLDQGVTVGSKKPAIMEHYGWLIEAFLQKILTKQDDGTERPPLLRLSYMVEAYQSSLRFLCYVQMAQIFRVGIGGNHPAIQTFIHLTENGHPTFDFLNLLVITAELLPEAQQFMPEITDFVQELTDTNSDTYQTALFLDSGRRHLLQGTRKNDDPALPDFLEEYLTALVFWLRQLAFLAKYRLVSIKDINLNYRLGTSKKFVHLYGELHGIYNAADITAVDYGAKEIEDLFTYNQSVLLFKGKNIDDCLEKIGDPATYISLSPLLVDQSVFSDKTTQTPEIYYFVGSDPIARRYDFAQFKNELPFGERTNIASNKFLRVKKENRKQPKLNDLFKQLELVFKPFKNTQPV